MFYTFGGMVYAIDLKFIIISGSSPEMDISVTSVGSALIVRISLIARV